MDRNALKRKPGGFGQVAHDVEVLDGLAGGAFDEVILGAHEDEAPGAGVVPPGDVEEVGMGHVF